MQKVDAINKRKQSVSEMAQRIEQLKQDFVHTQSQCRSVSDVRIINTLRILISFFDSVLVYKKSEEQLKRNL